MGIFNDQSDNQHPFSRGIQGAPGVGFLLTSDGNYDMAKKKLTNVADGTDQSDAVTKKQLDAKGSDVTKNIDLKNQFNVENGKNRTYQQLTADDDSLVSFKEVKDNFNEIHETMTTNFNMGANRIDNVKTPTVITGAAIKGYVDTKIEESKTSINGAYVPKTELENYLKRDGTAAMTGDLKMGAKHISNLHSPEDAYDGTTKKYVDDALAQKASTASVNQLSSSKADKIQLGGYLKRDGSVAMTGDLVMGSKKITKLEDPSSTKDAVNKQFLDNALSLKANTSSVTRLLKAKADKT